MDEKRISRRGVLKVIGASAAGAVLSQCKAEETAEPISAPTVITKPDKLNAIYVTSGTLVDDYYAQLSESFKEETGIEVEFTLLNFEKAMDKELTIVAGKSSDVDVFGTHYAQIGRFAEAMEPLNDWAARDGVVSSNYVEGSFDAFTNASGGLLAIPYWLDVRAFYYRTDLLEEAGFTSPPTTWDELLEIAIAINNPPDVYGYFTTGRGDPALREFSDMLWENGGDFLEDGLNPSKPIWNQPEGVEALEWWYDLLHTHKVLAPGTPSYEWVELKQIWQAGQAGMCKQWGSGPSLDPEQSVIVDKFGIANIPLVNDIPVEEAKTTAVCHGRGINIYSEKKEAAWEFIKYCTSKEEQLNMFDVTGKRPAHTGAMDEAFSNATGMVKQDLEAALYAAKHSYTWPLFPAFSEIQPILWTELEKVITDQKPAKEALDFAATEAEKVLKDAGLIS